MSDFDFAFLIMEEYTNYIAIKKYIDGDIHGVDFREFLEFLGIEYIINRYSYDGNGHDGLYTILNGEHTFRLSLKTNSNGKVLWSVDSDYD